MNPEWKTKLLSIIKRYQAPLLVLMLGVLLMLLPSGGKEQGAASAGEKESLAGLLSSTEGVGESHVLVSESGVVVVCEGADNAAVRLDIIRAVGSYTGFSSDRITILKLAD